MRAALASNEASVVDRDDYVRAHIFIFLCICVCDNNRVRVDGRLPQRLLHATDRFIRFAHDCMFAYLRIEIGQLIK